MKVLLILLILFFFCGEETTFASDYWLNIFEEKDKEVNSGNGIVDNSTDSAILAWGESYWLESYCIEIRTDSGLLAKKNVYSEIWQPYSFVFTSPSDNGENLMIRCVAYSTNGKGAVHFDNIRMMGQ